jgi:hypothetical protein
MNSVRNARFPEYNAKRSWRGAEISPRASATPSCARPSKPTARCGPSAYRAVPVPPALLEALDLVHGIRDCRAAAARGEASGSGPGAA